MIKMIILAAINGTPLPYSCLENPMDGRAWQTAVHGVAKSRTQLSDFTFTFMQWRRKCQLTPVFLPGESQGQRSLLGCRLCGCTESDMTEATQQHQQQSQYSCNLIAQKLHALLPSSLPSVLDIEKPLRLGWSPNRSHVTGNQSLLLNRCKIEQLKENTD